VEQLQISAVSDRKTGTLAGRGAFVEAYNTLLSLQTNGKTKGRGAPFAYDQSLDRYFYDGKELNGSVLVELRLLCARKNQRCPCLDTIRDAAAALCEANTVNRTNGLPWQAAVGGMLHEAITNDDRDFVRTITVRGVPFWFVAMRDIKLALGAKGAKGATRIRAAMKALGWRATPAIVHGRRTRGFIRSVTS
jgi:hypothetical protein